MPNRSKGCRVCIRRRIKCDEKIPECFQCLSSGWKCPGPRLDAHFIDMSAKIRDKFPGSHTPKFKPQQKQIQKHDSLNNATDESKRLSAVPDTSSQVYCELSRLPTTYQPKKGNVFQHLYIAHFISSNEIDIQPWITYLPTLLSSSPCQESPEVFAIRAATMALYGRQMKDRAMETEAVKSYSNGLESHRKNLSRATQYSERFMSRAVCAAMMFAFFESVLCTSPLGWLQHFRAAEQMLAIVGPRKCQNGLMHMMFHSMRIASLTTSMVLDKPSIFASEIWCTVPFELQPKSSLSRLLDILLQLPSCLPIRNKMRKLREQDPIASELLRQKLEAAAQQIQSRLNQFKKDEWPHIDSDNGQRLKRISVMIQDDVIDRSPLHRTAPSQNPFSAYLRTMYDAGNIIVLSQLAAASLTPQEHQLKMLSYGDSIISSAAYHDSQDTLTSISFSMIFPIKIALHFRLLHANLPRSHVFYVWLRVLVEIAFSKPTILFLANVAAIGVSLPVNISPRDDCIPPFGWNKKRAAGPQDITCSTTTTLPPGPPLGWNKERDAAPDAVADIVTV
ncbi:hypothetical protein G7Y89_g8903 [Cudoniella acicularis]|uniref:Zn(2)-C6 fungal-type domain-containing protein n=1 Tax=Cudoniella acicularis TaxID=354080 RepID=A0A8H4W057_9HELO|nr:hypothetical protein G7Y89_g8903 [Cudoniella acicularis]